MALRGLLPFLLHGERDERMLKIGIIGTGGIADAHIRGYLEFPDECEIVALADIHPGKAASKAEAFGLVGAATYDDPAELIAAGGVDLISIATPPSSVLPPTITAITRSLRLIIASSRGVHRVYPGREAEVAATVTPLRPRPDLIRLTADDPAHR